MTYIISIKELEEKLLNKSDRIVIIDVRFDLNNPDAGSKAYEEGHLPGAVYLDLEEDLSGDIEEHGGNHPLPAISELADKLGRAGVDNETTVIVYDQGNDMFAARCWWSIYYLGHQHVFVLDGGYQAWVEAGNQVTKKLPNPVAKTYHPKPRFDEVVNIERIRENIQRKEAVLIDSRSCDRYLGQTEPLYKKAGHIPGAKNYFWKNVLREDGKWKGKEELDTLFSRLDKNAEIIVSCGSGVSATPNVIGLKMAGFKNVKLYPGSYSDWISYEENEVETRDETND